MFDPYEWIDPEKGRQRRIVQPAQHFPWPDAFKMTTLRQTTIDALIAYAKANGRDAAVSVLARYGAKRLSDVPDALLPLALRDFSKA